MAVDAVEAKRLAKDIVGTRRSVIVGRYGTRKRVEERSGHAREGARSDELDDRSTRGLYSLLAFWIVYG